MRASIESFVGDIPASLAADFLRAKEVAVDTETSGLSYLDCRVELIQMFAEGLPPVFLKPSSGVSPMNFGKVVSSRSVPKILHHAAFDLRFMLHHFGITSANVKCTKVLAKIAFHDLEATSLTVLCQRFLGFPLDKAERLSDWGRGILTESQMDYALKDVLFLPSLLGEMEARSDKKSLALARRSFRYIPTRVALDVSGVGDVFVY